MPLKDTMLKMLTSDQKDLMSISRQKPVLLVFLRHFGCVFCREAMHDLSKLRQKIELAGSQLVFVHMSDNDTAEKFFAEFNLEGVSHISDPECKYYAAFGLTKGSFSQLMGLKTMTRGFQVAINKSIYPNYKFIGDGFQMPGVFHIKDGEIQKSFIHQSASDKPDYLELL